MSQVFKNLLSSANVFTQSQEVDGNLTVKNSTLILANSGTQMSNAGTFANLTMAANASSAGFNYFGSTLLNFDTTTTGTGAYFPCNTGFNFSATLTPVINSVTVDWTLGSSKIINAVSTTATLVVNFSNPLNGGRYVVETIGLTGRVWTFTGVKWAGGAAPTVTAVTNAVDMFEFYFDGTNYVGRIIAQHVS